MRQTTQNRNRRIKAQKNRRLTQKKARLAKKAPRINGSPPAPH